MPEKLSSPRNPIRALIIDDEADICRMLSMCLRAGGNEVTAVATSNEALTEARRRAFDLIFLDIRLGTENGLEVLQPLRETSPWLQVVVITAYAAVDTAVEAMKRGACEYLPKPFTPAQVRLVAQKAADAQALQQRAAALQDALAASGPVCDFDTTSTEMRAAVELARCAAEGNASILIEGEPGTGKRTLARAIHLWSKRAERPIAVAGCRAPTPAHLEAEWFGTARRMPGGQVVQAVGRVGYCDGGTMLIEDVDLLPAVTQPKLLRLIQEKEYERPADFSPHRADLRVIATTAADLNQLVLKGDFYPDLLHGLRTVRIELPPLRRRPDDTTLLARRFLAFFARQIRKPILDFDDAALESLRRHSWPGNIRELKNLVERAVLVCRGEKIETSDFPAGALNRINAVALGDPVPLERIEELHIRGVLAGAPSIESAASILGMDSVTLWRRRKQYGI